MLKEALYTGKILLFGEYGIIHDSMGLSIPYEPVHGSLKFESQEPEKAALSNMELRKYAAFLASTDQVQATFDIDRLKADLDAGLYFDSTIPQGFGVGSSGALVAAIYENYCMDSISSSSELPTEDLKRLKSILGQMETFFHGKSSGLDPLICYLNLPILIKSSSEMGTVGLPEQGHGKGAIFLLNTGMKGKTQPLVNHFLERCKEEGFRTMLKKEFKKYNDASIEAFLATDISGLMKNVKELSKVLLAHFSPMIPSIFQKLWKQGIETNAYYLKLCGSGGGGFILGFTEDFDKAESMLSGYELNRIHSF